MSDVTIQSEAQLRAVLDQITFAPSCMDMGWQWQIEELQLPSGDLRGWLVNTTFRRPDTHTGVIGIGMGRKELISYGASETAVVKTAWLLAELIVRHELMEAFLYRGLRIFNPHHTVDELSMPARFPQLAGPDVRVSYPTAPVQLETLELIGPSHTRSPLVPPSSLPLAEAVCPACGEQSSLTFTREEERFLYGPAPDAVEITAIVDKGRCSACTFEFTDTTRRG